METSVLMVHYDAIKINTFNCRETHTNLFYYARLSPFKAKTLNGAF